MHVAEMREREDFDEVLVATLSRGWRTQYGGTVEVRPGCVGPGQHWWYQPLFSAFIVSGANARVRRFLRDSFRYTPVTPRAVPQWLLGTALSSTVGLRLAGRPGFTVVGALDGAGSLAVIPGNQRVRVFDFHLGRTRVFLKEGFDARTMRTEIALRASGSEGPFPRIELHDNQGRWFEEPLLDAYALPRCPPWLPRRQLRRQALTCLESWASEACEVVDAGWYVSSLQQRIEEGLSKIQERFEAARLTARISAHLVWIGRLAGQVREVALVRSHGDFQPGNILVVRRTWRVTLIDWEHFGHRSRFYDRFVLSLHSRSADGLAGRIGRFLDGEPDDSALAELPSGRDWRLAHVGLFLLEDLEWLVLESQTGPFKHPSTGLVLYREELDRLQTNLSRPTT